jgi:RNA polymerase sigma factor (sigma-70 family)
MRPRLEVIEMFSAFAQLEADKFSRWLTDAKLRKSMQNCLNSSPEVANSENFWALYWHKHWQSNSHNFAKMHLSAYLQESCYRASEKMVAKFSSSDYGVADYFQIANTQIDFILKDFNAEKSSSLKYYAIMAMSSRLRDILRQRKEADICSDWALLRKVSKKVVLEALSQAGLSQKAIAQHRLAWTCFKELYIYQSGGTNKLPEPSLQLWEAITKLYNSQRQTQLNFANEECTSKTIEQWLTKTVVYLRAYLFPSVKSLDAFKQNDEVETLNLPDLSSDSPIADIISIEDIQSRKQQTSQMSGVLLNTLQQLDIQTQNILKLYYQEGLTQQQIIEHLQVSQPTVSRRLVKGRESLLAALVKWSQDLNIPVNSNQVKDMSIALEEYLRNHYGEFSRVNINP